jgi:hypothetical protein
MAKAKPERDEEREERITMEIIVDANGPEEQAMGWYYYLAEGMTFPFTATCIARRKTSPLKVGDEVEVTGMADADDCERDMFVTVGEEEDEVAVPLIQLQPVVSTDEPTKQAVEDWHYWVGMGYTFD